MHYFAAAILTSAASPTSGDPLVDWLKTGGTIGILATAVVAFMRGWIVSGVAHKRVLDERDRALELVFKQADLANRALEVSEKWSHMS